MAKLAVSLSSGLYLVRQRRKSIAGCHSSGTRSSEQASSFGSIFFAKRVCQMTRSVVWAKIVSSASPVLYLLACGLRVFRRSDSIKSAHKDSLNAEHHLSIEKMLPSKVTYVLCFPVAILYSNIPFCCHDGRIVKSSMPQVHVRQLVWLIFRR